MGFTKNLIIFCLVLSFFFGRALAGFDFQLNAVSRSYPLAGVINADLGYGILLWGAPGGGKPWYGYIRPSVTGSAITGFTAYRTQLEFFPISFIGVRGGYSDAKNRNDDLPPYDCTTLKCENSFERKFVGANMSLAAGPVFLNVDFLKETYEQDVEDQEFIAPEYGISLPMEGGHIENTRGIFGTKLGGAWSMFVLGQYTKELDSEHRARTYTLNFRRGFSGGSFFLGAGGFESHLKSASFTAVGGLTWNILPSIGLF
ncbi:MAG: hypothetical protein JNM93_03130 [Bacteriovoracaceae bacterium]|nr:hypothetical protein [Bacteriovoracaceae bacterium]